MDSDSCLPESSVSNPASTATTTLGTSSSQHSPAPTKLGKYEIIDLIGRGNMGVVYRARDPFADQLVAVKVCTVERYDPDSAELARQIFFNEARTAGALNHDHILKVFDAGEHEGIPYLVIELVPGAETLKHYCSADNLMPVEQIVRVMYQCAKALDYAHRRGVIHRDIKPSNILLTNAGEAKISDFGIARYAHSDAPQLSGLVGSPRYMSPEQAQDTEIGHQTDLFSLGAVVYELLAGRPAFQAKGFSRLIHTILHEDPPPLRRLRPEIPVRLERIIRESLRKKPVERTPSGQAIAAELAAVFADLNQPRPELSGEEKFRLMRGLEFFNSFSDSELTEVARTSEWRGFAATEQVIAEGTLDKSFFILVSGEVAVTKGNRQLSTLTRGDCFGEMGYVADTGRTASIVGVDPGSVLRIDSASLEKTSVACQLRFNQVFLRTLVDRLARTSQQLSEHDT